MNWEVNLARETEPDVSAVMPGHFKDDDHEAEELQEVARGARNDRRSVWDAHLLVRPGAKVLEVAV